MTTYFGVWRSLVARMVWDHEAAGSNPSTPTIMLSFLLTTCLICDRMEKYGEMSEWFKELVLKTSDSKEPRVRISVSPPKLYKR